MGHQKIVDGKCEIFQTSLLSPTYRVISYVITGECAYKYLISINYFNYVKLIRSDDFYLTVNLHLGLVIINDIKYNR